MRRRRLPALLLAIVTITAGAGIAGAPAAPARPVLPARVPTGRPSTGITTAVTLITGDRVTVRGNGTASVQPGPGREGMRFLGYGGAKSRYVVPADAVALLRAGRLDQRLFDLTAPAGYGYTDDRTEDLPLLLAYPKAANRRAAVVGALTCWSTAR